MAFCRLIDGQMRIAAAHVSRSFVLERQNELSVTLPRNRWLPYDLQLLLWERLHVHRIAVTDHHAVEVKVMCLWQISSDWALICIEISSRCDWRWWGRQVSRSRWHIPAVSIGAFEPASSTSLFLSLMGPADSWPSFRERSRSSAAGWEVKGDSGLLKPPSDSWTSFGSPVGLSGRPPLAGVSICNEPRLLNLKKLFENYKEFFKIFWELLSFSRILEKVFQNFQISEIDNQLICKSSHNNK